MTLPINTILQGDCLSLLPTLPNDSVDCVITSPPYWGQRCYCQDRVKLKDELPTQIKKQILKELSQLNIQGIIL